jgi:uncharacterized protein (TIGR02996 family)
MLDEREGFLRTIFATPEDDAPRLVFADWLDEHGFPDHATLIRIQCELARREVGVHPTASEYQIQANAIQVVAKHDAPEATSAFPNRGFRFCDEIQLTVDELLHPDSLRVYSAEKRPEWYGAKRLKITSGRVVSVEPFDTLYTLPVFEHVQELDISGSMRMLPVQMDATQTLADVLQTIEYDYVPSITLPGLEALALHRFARRLTVLNLTNNNLDNDSLHILVRSTQFTRIKELHLSSQGQRFRGRTWTRVLERFGEDVVF